MMNDVLFYGCLVLNIAFAAINFYQGCYVWGAVNLALAAWMTYQLVRR
jgi:hypothetical protein